MSNRVITKAFFEQHAHGAFGVDFLTCDVDELLYCAQKFLQNGTAAFCPTLATAPIEVLTRQIAVIEEAVKLQEEKKAGGARIFGVNLEACFISPEKSGIHDVSQLLAPTVENFKKLESDVIKIVTLAPELDSNSELINYLHSKGIKVFAGHTTAHDLSKVDGVTHLFNAMSGIEHRKKNTVTSALLDDNLFCEIIADGYHIDYDNVRLALKVKPNNRLILISDALPIAMSDRDEMEFCSKTIYLKDGRATDKNGTLAGSSMLLVEIVRKLVKNNIISLEQAMVYASNSAELFGIPYDDYSLIWDENLNFDIVKN